MPYIVPTTEAPTYWNKNAALGALIGTLFFPVIGTAIGGAIGGYIGNERMTRELIGGKVVKEPSFWNMKTAIGALLGKMGGGIVGAMVGGAIALLSFGFFPAIPCIYAGIALGALGGLIGGLIKGGEIGQAEMQRDYLAAQQNQGTSRQPTQARGMEFDNAMPTGKSYSADISSSRQQNLTPGTSRA